MVTQPTIELATVGWADSLILMVLALVVFGPRRLPQIARQVGKLSGLRGRVSWTFMVTQPTIELATVGWADSLILMVLALVVFGPRRLPQIARQVGKLMYE